jgi:hypothetical protein
MPSRGWAGLARLVERWGTALSSQPPIRLLPGTAPDTQRGGTQWGKARHTRTSTFPSSTEGETTRGKGILLPPMGPFTDQAKNSLGGLDQGHFQVKTHWDTRCPGLCKLRGPLSSPLKNCYRPLVPHPQGLSPLSKLTQLDHSAPQTYS